MDNQSKQIESNSNGLKPSQTNSYKGFFSFRRILLLSLLVGTTFLAIGIFFYLLLANARSGEIYFTPSEAVTFLDLTLPTGNIILSPWENDYISFSFEFSQRSSSRKEIIVQEKGNVWVLKWDHIFSPLDWKSQNLPTFKLQFPSKKFQNLRLRIQYGFVEIKTFKNWNFLVFLTSGKIFLHEQIGSTGDLQVGWGAIETQTPFSSKVWEKSTGFNAILETGEEKVLKLRTYIGDLRGQVSSHSSI